MDHSSPEILCVSAALRLLQRDSMPATIVFDDLRVVDGNVGGSLLKISYRIALSGHHTRNQPVRLNQAPVRIIYKPALNLMPSFQKVAAFCRSKSVDVKPLHPFRAVFERRFGSPTISCFSYSARVLWTKALSQPHRAITLDQIRNTGTNDQAHNKDNRNCCCVHLTDLLSSKSSSAEKMPQE